MVFEERYIAVDDDKEPLAHYGVLGMKWGIRKDRRSSSGRVKKSKRAEAKRKAEAAKLKRSQEKLRKQALESHDPEVVAKGMHLLTDEELGMKIKRLTEEHKVDNIRYENKQREISIAQQTKRGKNIAEKYGDAVVNQIVTDAAKTTVNSGKALGGLGFHYAKAVSGDPSALDNMTPEKFMGDFSKQLDWQNLSPKERSKIAAKRWA